MRFEAPPTIWAFFNSDAFVRCIVGPVGSGKSSACVLEIPRRALKQDPGPDGVRRTRWAVIRNTYPQLRDTTRKTFEQWIPPDRGRWHEQSFSFVMDRALSDGTRMHAEVLFRALDRPEDVKKLLSLELTGAYINEAREIPKNVFDVLQTRVSRFPSKTQGGPTWFGIWMDTNPWHTGHWGYRLFTRRDGLKPEQQHLFEVFEQPGGRTPQAENLENLEPGYYDRLTAGKDSQWIESYVDGKYPSSDVGSIWGRALGELEARGGICEFDHPADGVFTAWDLGVSDSTAIWFYRMGPDKAPDVIDHYENSGHSASHYFSVVQGKPYKYLKHWLPHDARQRSWQTGVGVVDQFVARFGAGLVAIGPELSPRDGISAGRYLLEGPMRIHTRCEAGIEALREYRYEFDEELRVFSTRPLHNWASHTADAFRYMASVLRPSEFGLKQPDNAKSVAANPNAVRLDDVWETVGRKGPSGRI